MVSYLFWIYYSTTAPGLSWANGGSDGGGLIAAAATSGIAHPSGYPVYLLLAKLFQALPFGSLAFRTNLLSCVAMTAASYWIFGIIDRSTWISNIGHRKIAGIIAGLAFGTSPIAWSQAVITEVYALHVFFVTLTLYMISDPLLDVQRTKKVFVIGIVLGLALGNHITSILLVPPIVVFVGTKKKTAMGDSGGSLIRKWRVVWKDLVRLLAGMSLTLSSYLVLPLWASHHPPVNWGNPVTLNNFIWLVTGELYQDQLVFWSQWPLLERLQDWARLLLQQFGILGLVFAVIGLVVAFVPNRIYTMTLWIALSGSVFAMTYQVVDWHIHLIPVYAVFGIWIGFGFSEIIEFSSNRSKVFGLILSVSVVIYFIYLAANTWKQVDASESMDAQNFGQQLIDDLPENAIVFADGDRTVFTLWYFHYALKNRSDIFVIAIDLLPFDWYRETLLVTYPGLEMPLLTTNNWQDSIVELNSAYPACFPFFSDVTVLNCR